MEKTTKTEWKLNATVRGNTASCHGCRRLLLPGERVRHRRFPVSNPLASGWTSSVSSGDISRLWCATCVAAHNAEDGTVRKAVRR